MIKTTVPYCAAICNLIALRTFEVFVKPVICAPFAGENAISLALLVQQGRVARLCVFRRLGTQGVCEMVWMGRAIHP